MSSPCNPTPYAVRPEGAKCVTRLSALYPPPAKEIFNFQGAMTGETIILFTDCSLTPTLLQPVDEQMLYGNLKKIIF